MTLFKQKPSVYYLAFLLVMLLFSFRPALAASGDFYQFKVYHLKDAEQESRLDAFLKDAYLPALHRAGIAKVGVFKPVKESAEQAPAELLVYVFIPFKSSDDFFKLDEKLSNDKKYAEDGKDYLDAAYDHAPYERIESILLTAFTGSPNFSLPNLKSPAAERVYELRSYESPTEKNHISKVKMFNTGNEIGIFKRLGFNAVFYARVISGSQMPNLMYLTTFENKADRDAHWKNFSADAEWSSLKAQAEYLHNVSRNDTRFLYPTDYSDI